MSLRTSRKRKYVLGVLSVLLFIGVSIFLFVFLTPEKIIDLIGEKNSYVFIFIVAIAGGFTTFNIIPYHPILIALAAGGLNPYALGMLAALGVTLGDTTSYWLGTQGRVLLPERTNAWFTRIYKRGEKNPRLLILLFFLYSTFMPTSNDLLTIPAGILGIPFWRVMIPLFLGNVIFDIALAYLAAHAYDAVLQYFL